MLFISIPTPCREDWNKMTPNEKGAFCKVCSKTVVDFTTMTDEEVQNYFLNSRPGKTCGHFKKIQLEKSEQLLEKFSFAQMPYWQKFLAIVFISFSSLLTSCDSLSKGTKIGEIPLSDSLCNYQPQKFRHLPAYLKKLIRIPLK